MYEHTSLVQSTLEVLMARYSSKNSLLENVKNAQLLASSGRERQFRLVDQMLKQLEQNAETHELWGELESESDQAQNKQTKDILKELTGICRVRRQVLEFDEDYMADREIQDLHRHAFRTLIENRMHVYLCARRVLRERFAIIELSVCKLSRLI
eukprot:gene36292-44027_t